MCLGGLDLAIGVLVDGAIVMVENGYRRLSEAPANLPAPAGTVGAEHITYEEPVEVTEKGEVTENARRRILIDAAKRVGPALFFSLLIIVVSFIPVFLLEKNNAGPTQIGRAHV